MTDFDGVFDRTDAPSESLRSALDFPEKHDLPFPQVGTYSRGLLSILDDKTAGTLLQTWKHFVGPSCRALITTGFGDVYYWDERKSAVFFLNVQHAMVEFVDRSVEWVLNEFLTIPDIQRDVLHVELLTKLIDERRPLKYRECFILTPWQLLGGDESKDAFDIGQTDVYLDLVGQAHDHSA